MTKKPNVHELKTWPEFFAPIMDGSKTFEIRHDDRGFRVGDVLWLREWNPAYQLYSGRSLTVVVTYITDWQQLPRYVVMGLRGCHFEVSR